MNIFIGCSSSENIDKKYNEDAKKLAKHLVKNNHNLLIGGINGTMGTIIKTFNNNKDHISIYCVKDYYDNIENYHKKTFNTVNERKNGIIKDGEIYLFLPGGIGTIDEIFSIIEAKRAKQHNNKIIIINTNNYYNNLIKMLDKIYKDKFSDISNKKIYIIVNRIEDAIKYIN